METDRALGPFFGVEGRDIVRIIRLLADFWGRHRATLAGDLDPAVVAALDTVAAALATIELINPPGPE